MHRSILKWNKGLVALIVASLLVSWTGATRTSMAAPIQAIVAPGDQLFNASGDLNPGEKHTPGFPVYSARSVNLKLRVTATAGSGSVNLAFFDGTETKTFEDEVLSGETLWATLTLKPGNNEFQLLNLSGLGGPVLAYELWVYEVDQAPLSWAGESLGEGSWRSHIKLNFSAAGLYEFSFGVTSGRYQFLVDQDYIQKTVEAVGTVSYYVSAGVHDLYIVPDSAPGSTTAWSLDVSGAGGGNDALPYTKAGGNLGGAGNDFADEWLPLKLAAATKGNFRLALTGDKSQVLDVHLYGATGTTPVYTISDVFGGETVWWSADLAAGVSRVQLVAHLANAGPLAYALAVQAEPALPAGWSGVSFGEGNNSRIRFEVGTAGLYNMSYDVNEVVQANTKAAPGRYQFLVDSDVVIQKTVESSSTVRYYLSAGTHELTIVQDEAAPVTNWSLDVAGTGEDYDTLPYHQTGGDLGGDGNQFVEEWLPLYVETGGPSNFELTLNGDPGDGLIVSLYQNGAAVFNTPVVYGGETFWWPATLVSGMNLIRLTAGSNAGRLAYDLSVRSLASPPATWSGAAKGGAGNSVAQLDVGLGGTYSVTLETPTGFARVLVDGDTLARKLGVMALSRVTEFLVPLTAGIHQFEVLQDADYSTTEWTLGVEAASGDGVLARLTGSLIPGEEVDPQVPLFGTQNKAVNFRLSVTGGGPLDMSIEDGTGGLAFAGTAMAGETVWGTATLKPGQNTFTLHNGGAVSLDYDLTVYEIAEAPYDWAGNSAAAGDWNSHIRLAFPASGVYALDFGVASGRYQILVDDEYIQKIAEANGQVGYYVSAGEHMLTILPDRTGSDTSWMVGVSAPGAANDTLPYTRSGGELWNLPAQFNNEWLPLSLAQSVHANFELTLTGAPEDALGVNVYAGLKAGEVAFISDVHGGETVWWSADLPAGVSRIQLVADPANTGPLAYTLTVHAEPGVPASWSGVSLGSGNHSKVRFEVDAAGLYDIGFGVNSPGRATTNGIAAGRYQFLVDSKVTIQKTVESAGTVRYYLGAGTHELTIVQDELVALTQWSLNIAGTNEVYDTLPYYQTGGRLGGMPNQFVEEWLPINVQTGGPANFELTLDGELADGLVASLYQGATEVYSTPVIYGGETFWWPSSLGAGVNEIRLQAVTGNAFPLAYALTVHAAPLLTYNLPYAWGGVSRGTLLLDLSAPGQSEIEVHTPVSGTYHVALDMPNGFASMRIERPDAVVQAALQSHIEFDVPLNEGSYLFRVVQSPDYVTTTWSAMVSLKSALAPEVLSIDPGHVVNDAAHTLTIVGTNFQPGAEVSIGSTLLSPVTWLGSTTLQTEIPAGVAAGMYSVTVTNPDGKSDTLPDALEVANVRYLVYLPIVAKGGK